MSADQRARLLKLGHCPFDIQPEDEGNPFPEPHCHAGRDGDCVFAYCPQPLLLIERELCEAATNILHWYDHMDQATFDSKAIFEQLRTALEKGYK